MREWQSWHWSSQAPEIAKHKEIMRNKLKYALNWVAERVTATEERTDS